MQYVCAASVVICTRDENFGSLQSFGFFGLDPLEEPAHMASKWFTSKLIFYPNLAIMNSLRVGKQLLYSVFRNVFFFIHTKNRLSI